MPYYVVFFGAVKNCHKLNCLKQHKFINSSGGQKPKIGLNWASLGNGWFLPEALMAKSVSLSFSVSGGCLHSLVSGPFQVPAV